MEYRSINNIERIAQISGSETPVPLSVSQRLARWASLLERHGGNLRLLRLAEHYSTQLRASLHVDQSPFTIAYGDSILRLQGLRGETYGDALRFFRISNRRLHRITCSCFYFHQDIVPSGEIAKQVREAEQRASQIETIMGWMGAAPSRTGAMTAVLV